MTLELLSVLHEFTGVDAVCPALFLAVDEAAIFEFADGLADFGFGKAGAPAEFNLCQAR